MAVLGAGGRATPPQLVSAWRWGPKPPPPGCTTSSKATAFSCSGERPHGDGGHRRFFAVVAQPLHSEPIYLGCRQSTPFIQVGSASFRAIAIGSCELQNNQKQNDHRRLASGKIAIDRPLQQRKTRTFRRGLCPGGGENREGIAPQARSPRDAVSGVGLLHENDRDLDAHGRSECAHVHASWV